MNLGEGYRDSDYSEYNGVYTANWPDFRFKGGKPEYEDFYFKVDNIIYEVKD
jgi:hypothetical protein